MARGLSRTERDDAADGVIGRDANSDPVARHDLDSEAPHAAAQLGQYFVTRIALHAVETAGVNCHHGPLHVDQIVFAQIALPFASG